MTRRPKSVRLGVQTLEARDVPATLDVSFVGAEATANGAIFRQADAVAADQFDTFLRLLDNNGMNEEGYNTDARPFQFDQRGDLTVTHSLQLSDIPTVTIDGVVYREFLLDINEGDRVRRQTISLDQLRFFVGETGNLTGYNRTTRTLAGLTAVWDLDAVSNNSVVFRDGLTDGKGDAVVLIPDSAFAGADASDYIYLYSRFGGSFNSHGGAEEWGVRPVPPPPPPPTGGTLSGYVYVTLDGDATRDTSGEGGEPVESGGLSGVEITLSWTVGTDTFTLMTTTDSNGFYSFTNLAADVSYTISRGADPAGLFDGLNQAGPVGGQEGSTQERGFEDPNAPDLIFGVTLDAGENKTEYNFGMFEAGPPA